LEYVVDFQDKALYAGLSRANAALIQHAQAVNQSMGQAAAVTQQAAVQMNRSHGQMQQGIKDTSHWAMATFDQALWQARSMVISMGMAAIVAGVVGVGVALEKTAAAGIRFNAQLESSRLAFETMLGSTEAAKEMLDGLYELAAKSPFEFPQLIEAAQRMKAFGMAADEIIPTMTAVGNAVSALGGDAQKIDRITLALGQMQSKGRVMAQEMLQLSEAGVAAWDILATKAGRTRREMSDLVEKGLVPAHWALQALTEGMDERFGGMMAKQADTMRGVTTTIRDYFNQFMGLGTESLFENLKGGLMGLRDTLADLNEDAKQFGFMGALERNFPLLHGWMEAIGLQIKLVGEVAQAAAPLVTTLVQSFAVPALEAAHAVIKNLKEELGKVETNDSPSTWARALSATGEAAREVSDDLGALGRILDALWNSGKKVDWRDLRAVALPGEANEAYKSLAELNKIKDSWIGIPGLVNDYVRRSQQLLEDFNKVIADHAAEIEKVGQAWQSELNAQYDMGGAYDAVRRRKQEALSADAAAQNAAAQNAVEEAKKAVDARTEAEIAGINRVREARLAELKEREKTEESRLSVAQRFGSWALEQDAKRKLATIRDEQDAVTEQAEARTEAVRKAAAAEKEGMEAVRVSAGAAQVSLAEVTAELEKQNQQANAYFDNLIRLAAEGYPELTEAIRSSGLKPEEKRRMVEEMLAGAPEDRQHALDVLRATYQKRTDEEGRLLAAHFDVVKTAFAAGGREAALAVAQALAGGGQAVQLEVDKYARYIAQSINPILEALGYPQIKVLDRDLALHGARGIRPEADGGVIAAFAQGHLPEQAVIQKPVGRRGLIQWAEPETKGEAFIPLAPEKRGRSLSIWAETGRLLGAFAGGGVLTPDQIGSVARLAGFGGQNLVTAIAVALAESGGYPLATNYNPGSHSTDLGLWQINDYYNKAALALGDWRLPRDNARMAMHAYRGRAQWDQGPGGGWRDWSAYLNGRYRQFLDEAQAGASGLSNLDPARMAAFSDPFGVSLRPPNLLAAPGDPRLSLAYAGNLAMQSLFTGASRWLAEAGYIPATGSAYQPGTTSYGGMVPTTEGVWWAVKKAFPQAQFWGGRGRTDRPGDHDTGHAFDVHGSWGLMQGIAAWLAANAGALPLKYVIFNQRIWSKARAGEGWRLMEDRGNPTSNHMDHDHVSTYLRGGFHGLRTYDRGGWLQPGYTLAYNGTEAPEPVLSFADGGVAGNGASPTATGLSAVEAAASAFERAAAAASMFAAKVEYLKTAGYDASRILEAVQSQIVSMAEMLTAKEASLAADIAAGAPEEALNKTRQEIFALDVQIVQLKGTLQDEAMAPLQATFEEAASQVALLSAELDLLRRQGGEPAAVKALADAWRDQLNAEIAAKEAQLELAVAQGRSTTEVNRLRLELAGLRGAALDAGEQLAELARQPLEEAAGRWAEGLSQTRMLMDMLANASPALVESMRPLLSGQLQGQLNAQMDLLKTATDPDEILSAGQAALSTIASMYQADAEAIDRALKQKTDALEESRNQAVAALDAEAQALDEHMERVRKHYDDRLRALDEAQQAEERSRARARMREDLAEIQRSQATIIVRGVFRTREERERLWKLQQDEIAQREKAGEQESDWALEDEKKRLKDERDAALARLGERKKALEDERKAVEDHYLQLKAAAEKDAEDQKAILAQKYAEMMEIVIEQEAELLGEESNYLTVGTSLGDAFGSGMMNALSALIGPDGQMLATGQQIGNDLATGLTQSIPAVTAAAAQMAQALSQYLKTGSPTEKGPMATLDHWWDSFIPTLIRPLEAADLIKPVMDTFGPMQTALKGGPPAGGSSGSTMFVQVKVEGGPEWSEETEARVADKLGKAIARAQSAHYEKLRFSHV